MNELEELNLLNQLIELGAKAAHAHAQSNSDDGHKGTVAYVQWHELRAEMGELIRAAYAPQANNVLEDAARLNWLQENSCDLRCIGVPTGGDDYDINWIVIEHHQATPHEREIGRSYTDDPRVAIDAARKQGGA